MAKGGWVTVSPSSLDNTREAYKEKAHVFSERLSKKSAWPAYCRLCGLVKLKNDLTKRATVLGCYYADHPSWRTR